MRLLAAAVASLFAVRLFCLPAAAQTPSSCAEPAPGSPVSRPDGQGRTLLFDQFVLPLLDESAQRRARWSAEDPLYTHRVNADLNANRLNFALLGFGEEHEQTYGDAGISVTILSL